MSSSKIQEYNLDPNMGLAKESSIQEIKNLIGEAVATQLNTLKTELISAMSENSGSSGIVKSVQRGTTTAASVTISAVDPNKCMVILNNQYLGNTALAWGWGGSGETYEAGITPEGAYLSSLSSTKLTISANKVSDYTTDLSGDFNGFSTITGKVSWQVIEFY